MPVPRQEKNQEGQPRPLKEQHKDHTRALILRALADVIAERGVHNFSVQQVADRAGVAHRTVYHHFATREGLLEALAEWLDAELRRGGMPGVVASADSLAEDIELGFRLFEEYAPLVRALAITYTSTGFRPAAREERTQAFKRVLREVAPEASEEEVQQAWIVVRGLASSQTWLFLHDQLGVSGAEAGRAVAWALRTLIDDLRSKNRRTARPGGGKD